MATQKQRAKVKAARRTLRKRNQIAMEREIAALAAHEDQPVQPVPVERSKLVSGVNALVERAHSQARESGFWKSQSWNFGEKLALIHSEVSEALEADRHGNPMDQHLVGRCSIEVELADVVIRVADLAGKMGINLGEVIEEKLDFNRQRAFMHGKAF